MWLQDYALAAYIRHKRAVIATAGIVKAEKSTHREKRGNAKTRTNSGCNSNL